jgi:hypothetical protein
MLRRFAADFTLVGYSPAASISIPDRHLFRLGHRHRECLAVRCQLALIGPSLSQAMLRLPVPLARRDGRQRGSSIIAPGVPRPPGAATADFLDVGDPDFLMPVDPVPAAGESHQATPPCTAHASGRGQAGAKPRVPYFTPLMLRTVTVPSTQKTANVTKRNEYPSVVEPREVPSAIIQAPKTTASAWGIV